MKPASQPASPPARLPARATAHAGVPTDTADPVDAASAVDRARYPYRMKDLCALTGLSRQVIHFYIQQRLLPEGKKTGHNMAYYGEEHLERVRLIRRLQHERFLPLKAIRALLDAQVEQFSPAQRQMLRALSHRIAPAPLPGRASAEAVAVDALLAQTGIGADELDAMAHEGLLAVVEGDDGVRRVSADDVWMLELFGELRRAGFTRELGFTAADLAIYDQAMTQLFEREAEILIGRLSALPVEQAAQMVERAIPLIHQFLARYHATKIRNFFAALS